MLDYVEKSILGFMILNLPSIFMASWGNIEIYLQSYYHYKNGFTYIQFGNIVVIFTASVLLSMILLPFILKKAYDKIFYVFLSLVGSAFFLNLDRAASIFELYSLVVFLSFAQRLLLAMSNYTIAGLIPNKRSFSIGILQSAISISNIVWSVIMTKLINPENKPLLDNGVFSKDVADNLHSFLILIFIFGVICSFFGVYLLSEAIDNEKKKYGRDIDGESASIASSLPTVANDVARAIELEEFFLQREQKVVHLNDQNNEHIFSKSSNNLTLGIINSTTCEQNNSNDEGLSKLRTLKRQNTDSFIFNLDKFNSENITSRSPNKSDNRIYSSKYYKYEHSSRIFRITRNFTEEIRDEELVDRLVVNEKIETGEKLSEIELIKRFLLSDIFTFIFVTAVIRNTFSLFMVNNYKNIALTYINDDHFISFTSSFAIVLSFIFEILGGWVTDKYGLIWVTVSIYVLNLIFIILSALFPTSKLSFVIAISIFRIQSGINSTLNVSIIYQVYHQILASRLLKYFTINSVISIIFGNVIYNVLNIETSHFEVWSFYFVLNVLGIVYVGVNTLIYENCPSSLSRVILKNETTPV